MAAQEIVSPELTTPHQEALQTGRQPTEQQENVTQETLDASTGFVGQWHTLVSTTNWDKGRIICAWRKELKNSGAPVSQYSDEAWAQIVGDVTGQHVGRLRRTSERFGEVAGEYEGLYWSHFQTALDWQDAEMWLEGALQNGWSVSQMRAQRWETVGDGDAPEERPADSGEAFPSAPAAVGEESESVDAEIRDASDQSDEDHTPADAGDDTRHDASLEAPAAERREPVRPMKDLAELPDDLAEAFEQFKLAILTHKMTGWSEISREDVLASLAALEQLALAPSGE